MAREQNNHRRYGADAGDGSVSEELEQLHGRYAKFRREHQPRMRIPEELRKAALEAIASGIPEKLVREACRISPGQLNRWREIQWVRGRKKGEKSAKPRVYKVVDTPPEKKVPNIQRGTPSAPVHLRIGEWDICIRQVGR